MQSIHYFCDVCTLFCYFASHILIWDVCMSVEMETWWIWNFRLLTSKPISHATISLAGNPKCFPASCATLWFSVNILCLNWRQEEPSLENQDEDDGRSLKKEKMTKKGALRTALAPENSMLLFCKRKTYIALFSGQFLLKAMIDLLPNWSTFYLLMNFTFYENNPIVWSIVMTALTSY